MAACSSLLACHPAASVRLHSQQNTVTVFAARWVLASPSPFLFLLSWLMPVSAHALLTTILTTILK
jgi:hypothetical protein